MQQLAALFGRQQPDRQRPLGQRDGATHEAQTHWQLLQVWGVNVHDEHPNLRPLALDPQQQPLGQIDVEFVALKH